MSTREERLPAPRPPPPAPSSTPAVVFYRTTHERGRFAIIERTGWKPGEYSSNAPPPKLSGVQLLLVQKPSTFPAF